MSRPPVESLWTELETGGRVIVVPFPAAIGNAPDDVIPYRYTAGGPIWYHPLEDWPRAFSEKD